MSYTLKLIDKEIPLSDQEGEVVKQVLQTGGTKWLELGKDLINTAQVMGVYWYEESKKFKALPMPTEKEQVNRGKVLEMIREKLNY